MGIGRINVRLDTVAQDRCPACHAPVTVAQHAKRGSWLYLTSTAQSPYSTADLHLTHCHKDRELRRIMLADQHLKWTRA